MFYFQPKTLVSLLIPLLFQIRFFYFVCFVISLLFFTLSRNWKSFFASSCTPERCGPRIYGAGTDALLCTHISDIKEHPLYLRKRYTVDYVANFSWNECQHWGLISVVESPIRGSEILICLFSLHHLRGVQPEYEKEFQDVLFGNMRASLCAIKLIFEWARMSNKRK